jgi:integrase/recombinase XerD
MTLEGHQVVDLYDYVQAVRPELISQEPMGKGQPDRETQKLFIGAGGNSKSFHNFTGQLIRTLKATNAKLENGKQIRASVIVKWLKNHNLREAQVLAGHKFISTTEAYQQSDMEGLKEEVNQFHPF